METYPCIVFPCYRVRGVMSNYKWKILDKCVPKTYAERKKEIVNICQNELKKSQSSINNEWNVWFMKQPKKDDLADAYVQGICCTKVPVKQNSENITIQVI